MVTLKKLVVLTFSLILVSVARAALIVTWVGPDQIGLQPVAGTDYALAVNGNNEIAVVLITTWKNTVAVTKWRIGTTDGSNIGAVTTAWQLGGNDPNDIAVEVGTITSAPVHDLGNIDIASESTAVPPATWSNVKLNLTGSVSRVRCYANASGQGGRLSGFVAKRSTDIAVHALGEGASIAGKFESGCAVGSAATAIVIDELEPNAKIMGFLLSGPLEIQGNLRGRIVFQQILHQDYDELCDQPGNETLDGRVIVYSGGVSDGIIDVGTDGGQFISGLWGGQITIAGEGADFAGSIEISRILPGVVGGQLAPALVSVRRLSGSIHVTSSTPMWGTIDILGDVLGTIAVDGGLDGSLTEEPLVRIRGNLGAPTTRQGKVSLLGEGIPAPYGSLQILGNAYGRIQIGGTPGTDAPLRGSIIIGQAGVGGDLAGTIDHYGRIAPWTGYPGGELVVHGNLSGQYVQHVDSPGLNEYNTGTLTIGGDLSGTVALVNALAKYPFSEAIGRVTVGRGLGGLLTLANGMRDGVIELNTDSGDLTGTIILGSTGLVWSDDQGIVSLSDLVVHGNFKASGEIIFRGCFDTIPGTYTFHQYCIEGQQDGAITQDFCAGAEVHLLNCSPP